MAKSIHLRLTGEAEKFIEEMRQYGLTEADVFARSIYLLQQVWRTKRVALIKEGIDRDAEEVEYFFGIQLHKQAQEDFSSEDAWMRRKRERAEELKRERREGLTGNSTNESVNPDS